MSKAEQRWRKARKAWFEANPPNFQGYYECYICHKWISRGELTIDHIIPRSRAPHLRYELSNLRPCCYPCNSKKGSKVYDKLNSEDIAETDLS